MDMIEAIAQELVAQNVNSTKELIEDLDAEDEFNESNFDTYGICEENVSHMVKHNMDEILKRAQQIQRERFKADPEIAAIIKPI